VIITVVLQKRFKAKTVSSKFIKKSYEYQYDIRAKMELKFQEENMKEVGAMKEIGINSLYR
jgi:hypothetical protein